MRRSSVWFTIIYLITTFFLLSFSQSETEEVIILSPAAGQAVQGLVEIIGHANPDDFEEFTLSFQLQDSSTDTFFEIEKSNEEVESGKLGNWETSTLTDDTYILELRVTLSDGNEMIHLVEGIRVRNYTAIETNTPEPETTPSSFEPTQTKDDFQIAETTPDRSSPPEIASNPAEISIESIQRSIVLGIIISISGLVLLALYILFKNRD